MADPVVLITGATGILGGATLAELVRTRPDTRILALVRAASAEEGRARLQQALTRFQEPCEAAEKIEVLCGDIAEAATYDDLRLDDVTHVIHAAANTSFRSVRGVRRVNILGTMTLAHRMRRARKLQRFVHVGTAFSCGLIAPNGALIGEDDYPNPDVRHWVEYTNAKAEAEMLLQNTAPELPLVIARPSVIVGHTQLGCAASASIFWFYRSADLLRRVLWPLETRDDIIAQDYAAHALVTLLFKPQLAHRRYHISSGEGASVSWSETAAAFARHHGERTDDPYRVVEWETIVAERARMAPRLGPGDEERLLMALGYYYRFPNFLFDNTRLLAEGVPPPTRFTDYLDTCMTRPGARSVYQQMTDDD